MNIDWKAVAQSPGYKSLKAAYIRDVSEAANTLARGGRPMRSKETFLKLFQWVIGRAQHYAARTGKPIEEILNDWESRRDYWWLNYYQPSCERPPKLSSGKPRNVQHQKPETYLRKIRHLCPEDKFKRIRQERQREAEFHRKHRTTKKPRWSAERKAREARYRKYR